ncbi:MAG: ABC transporter permease [Cyclobacteriaceae bacterium]|nr:ABC transporter permease [Cyclobacteriaceae bacterium]
MTLLYSFRAELIKLKHSPFVWVSFIAFALGPIMGGIILYVLGSGNMDPSSMLSQKAQMMDFKLNWDGFFILLSQVVGVGGVMIFGFVASWLFGREYSDKTSKDLLALPISRSTILNAKFLTYILWCIALVVSNLLLGLIIGKIMGLTGLTWEILIPNLTIYIVTTLMVVALGSPISFFALWGKGYMAPLGFLVLTLVFAQIVAAVGYGHLFPWALPGLYSGTGGEAASHITSGSFIILILMALTGYIACQQWWRRADQH